MNKDYFEIAKRAKEKHREKVGNELKNRIRTEAGFTLKFIDKQRAKGYTDKEIAEDLKKSKL